MSAENTNFDTQTNGSQAGDESGALSFEANALEQNCDDANIAQADSLGSFAHSQILWLLPLMKQLAFAREGCRIIQKAFQCAATGDQILLAKQLEGSINDLYKCPNGNHVLIKMIEVMPPANLAFLVESLSGKAASLARHQYGCRIMERILEHFPAGQICDLIEEILTVAEPLSRHAFGNFVIQHLFEHGPEHWKAAIAKKIIPVLPSLATHRVGSHVVQSALKFSNEATQHELAAAIAGVGCESSFLNVATSRYGSFVVREMAGMKDQECYERVRSILEDALPYLSSSPYGKRTLAPFGLIPECGGRAELPSSHMGSDEHSLCDDATVIA